jgi:arylsulfatase A-like enzyme
VNYYDVHHPYQIPEGSIRRFGVKPRTDRELDLIENWRTVDKPRLSPRDVAFARDAYDDCVAHLDEQLGRLLDELGRRGLLEQTWLIVTSDHGESFGEQPGDFGHGTSLYQPQLHVPLLIVPPAGDQSLPPRVISETVSLRDLPATVVDLVGLQAGAPFPGASLARLWDPRSGSAAPDHRASAPSPALSEVVPTNVLDPEPEHLLEERPVWASLAEGDTLYIQVRYRGDTREQLFDLHADPRESRNLAGDPAQQQLLERMRATLGRLTAGPLTLERFRP